MYLEKFLDEDKMVFQTVGVDNEMFRPKNKIKVRRELHLNEKDKIALFIGRFTENKGIKCFLEGIESFLNEKNSKAIFIGEGELEGDIRRFSEKKGFEAKILIEGRIPPETLVNYYNAADFFILPSLNEGAPATIMESLLCNTPVITTDVGGIKKMIKDKREGLIIKLKSSAGIKEAIKEILKWKNRNVKQYAEKYKWKNIIKKIKEDYEKY